MSISIGITRPIGNYRSFERPVSLPDAENQPVRYRFLFSPSGRDVGCWYLTVYDALGVALARSLRLVKTADVFKGLRQRQPGLPYYPLRIECPRDPQLLDLTTDLVQMWYDSPEA